MTGPALAAELFQQGQALCPYGAGVPPLIARSGEDIYVSMNEPGRTREQRWQLWHRSPQGWAVCCRGNRVEEPEPCPLVVLETRQVLVSARPNSDRADGNHTVPYIAQIEISEDSKYEILSPAWPDSRRLTIPAYRGLASDARSGEVLTAGTAGPDYEASCMDWSGTWHPIVLPAFPVRACYVTLALSNRAGGALAVGDITEPVPEWFAAKEEAGSVGFVFRRLFYTSSSNIYEQLLSPRIELDSVEAEAGQLQHLDLVLDADGRAHVLYLKTTYSDEVIVRRFYPTAESVERVVYAIVENRVVVRRRVLLGSKERSFVDDRSDNVRCSCARFSVGKDGRLYVVASATVGGRCAMLLSPVSEKEAPSFVAVAGCPAYKRFFTASPRGGSCNAERIDVLAEEDDGAVVYARIALRPIQANQHNESTGVARQ